MKLALGFKLSELTDENLAYALQLGVTHAIVEGPRLGDRGVLEFLDLLRLRKRIESCGLEVAGIENLPVDHWDKILHGTPGRDEQIEKICETLENMGRAGFPILGYYFSIAGVWGHWRSYDSGGGRGGAGVKSFDYDLVKDAPSVPTGPVSVEEMWSRLLYFLERVIPVAERSGVKLAAHPDDPPAEELRGAARILTSHEAMKRLVEAIPSPSNGLEFCQGTIAEMGPDRAIEAIRTFGGQKKIFYVHFRNVRGRFPKFDEVFIDEGDVDMFEAMRAYREVGFDGVMTPDHTPRVVGDTPFRHRGMACALGYMKALAQVVDKRS